MDTLTLLVAGFGFAFLRLLPVVGIAALSPLSWAPGLVRLVLVLALAWLMVLSASALPSAQIVRQPGSLILACLGELVLGLVFSLGLVLPQAGLAFAARLADTQAGLSAATVFNPGGNHEVDALLGTVASLIGTVLFFTLGLHLQLFALLTRSVEAIPLGTAGARLSFEAFLQMVSAAFVLAMALFAPMIVGLFALDVGVAYATRSMPQANVYFLILPLKLAVALTILAFSLPFAPAVIGRLYGDALERVPAVMGF